MLNTAIKSWEIQAHIPILAAARDYWRGNPEFGFTARPGAQLSFPE